MLGSLKRVCMPHSGQPRGATVIHSTFAVTTCFLQGSSEQYTQRLVGVYIAACQEGLQVWFDLSLDCHSAGLSRKIVYIQGTYPAALHL